MTTEQYASQIVEKLKTAETKTDVEAIIEQNTQLIKRCFAKLEEILEQLSPLAFNSTQWSCFRYAKVYLRRQQLAEAI